MKFKYKILLLSSRQKLDSTLSTIVLSIKYIKVGLDLTKAITDSLFLTRSYHLLVGSYDLCPAEKFFYSAQFVNLQIERIEFNLI